MEVCRVCLSTQATKEISELRIYKSDPSNSYIEIMLFCLDIKVAEDSKMTNKLCLRCYKKIIGYYKFKTLALKSKYYLESLGMYDECNNSVFVSDDVKKDEIVQNAHNPVLCTVKLEPMESEDFKEEDTIDYQSDDELLSVVKMIKYEFVSEEKTAKEKKSSKHNISFEEVKENAPIKRRGRRKALKTKLKVEEKTREVCEECGKVVANIKEHANMHLPVEQRKRFQCKFDTCDRNFGSYNARKKHFRIKHLGIKSHCDICNKDVVNLKNHQMVVHNKDLLPYECVPCGRRFVSRSALELHTTIHTKDRPFECDICQKKYRSKLVLTAHIRSVHDKEKSHICHICSKRFFKKYHLVLHMRGHTKEKPYECEECGKSFSSSTGLRSHRLIHSEVKMFLCNHCDSSFSKPNYLRAHMISHTKEKKHACKYCGVKFGRSDHRKRHEFTAHENRLSKNL